MEDTKAKKDETVNRTTCASCGGPVYVDEHIVGGFFSFPAPADGSKNAVHVRYPEITKSEYLVCWPCVLHAFGIKEL